jgi:hypothetical protein
MTERVAATGEVRQRWLPVAEKVVLFSVESPPMKRPWNKRSEEERLEHCMPYLLHLALLDPSMADVHDACCLDSPYRLRCGIQALVFPFRKNITLIDVKEPVVRAGACDGDVRLNRVLHGAGTFVPCFVLVEG